MRLCLDLNIGASDPERGWKTAALEELVRLLNWDRLQPQEGRGEWARRSNKVNRGVDGESFRLSLLKGWWLHR